MGFCVNFFIVGANFEIDPRWIFFTDGQFLTISRELVLIFDKITYASFAMVEREGEGKRKLHHRGKLCQGRVASFF